MRYAALCLLAATLSAGAAEKKVHIVYMGGNDCPPCRAWRVAELPKLEKMESFQRVKFTYVEKLIASPVPPSLFMPSDVKPYKDQLDAASGGAIGSPQTAILVDGRVYDYYFGTRDAAQIDSMIKAIEQGKGYPFDRCVKRDRQKKCDSPITATRPTSTTR